MESFFCQGQGLKTRTGGLGQEPRNPGFQASVGNYGITYLAVGFKSTRAATHMQKGKYDEFKLPKL